MSLKSNTYKVLKFSNDVNAIRKRRVKRRVKQRILGKIFGRILRRL